MAIRVLVVDDHPLIRNGLRQMIEAEADLRLAGEAASGAAAFAAVESLQPDVVIMDVEMPGENGIEASRRIVASFPATKILILSAYPDPGYVTESIKAGACGYLVKGNAPAEVISAIRAVMSGQTFMSPEATSALISTFRAKLEREQDGPLVALSPREREVLALVVEGLRTKEIAARLNIGTKTIDTHRARLMKKLKCSSTAELVRYAIREGLAS